LHPGADGGTAGATGGSSYAAPGGAGGTATPNSDAGADGPAADGSVAANFDPGSVGMRQLSGAEYERTIQDLLGLAPTNTSRTGDFLDTFRTSPGTFDFLSEVAPLSEAQFEAAFDNAISLVQGAFASDTLRARILTCSPPGTAWDVCARQIIQTFGLRAWRRPLTDGEVTDLVGLVGNGVMAGDLFTSAIQEPLYAMLASESFLYRLEFDPSNVSVHSLTPYELASRLSYLMWSSMPDDTLFGLAATDDLQKPDTLAAQVGRMLADPRSDGFVRNFFGQWLGFRKLDDADLGRKAPWSPDLQASASGEAQLFISEIVHGDVDVLQLLTADVNFVDAPLAALYGAPPPANPPGGLQRTVLPADARKGYLGLAAFLAVESEGDLSRMPRGSAISSALLCAPVPPPPPTVSPPLPPTQGTPQQQWAALQANPACAACHKLFEPIGLGLESFDEIGRFRTVYADGTLVDAHGALPDGTSFNGLAELADLLAKDPRVRDCARRQALVYAIGRPVVDADAPRLAAIDARWSASGNTVRGLLGAIVADAIFQYRRGEARP
jgi:hypothetical protein